MTEPAPTPSPQHHPSTTSNDVASCNKKSIDDAENSREDVAGETALVIDSAAERALCRKFDFRLLPVLAIMVCLAVSLNGKKRKEKKGRRRIQTKN
ncbi:hypothetical protein ANO14919_107000 [Xylariales sp. No.14919]|nr:hypothetical protein ANO14919_107000 [Xylariales sp. No.14919]